MTLIVNIFFLQYLVNKWKSQYFRYPADGRSIVSPLLAFPLSEHYN